MIDTGHEHLWNYDGEKVLTPTERNRVVGLPDDWKRLSERYTADATTDDDKAWRDAVERVLKRANEQRESWSQIARAQARAALDGLTFALTDEPTEADHG